MAGKSNIVRLRIPDYVLKRMDHDITIGEATDRNDWIMQAVMYKMYQIEIRRELLVAFDKMLENRLYSPQNEQFLRTMIEEIVTKQIPNIPKDDPEVKKG